MPTLEGHLCSLLPPIKPLLSKSPTLQKALARKRRDLEGSMGRHPVLSPLLSEIFLKNTAPGQVVLEPGSGSQMSHTTLGESLPGPE